MWVVQKIRSVSSDSQVMDEKSLFGGIVLAEAKFAGHPFPAHLISMSSEVGVRLGTRKRARSCSSGMWTRSYIFLRPEGKHSWSGFCQNQAWQEENVEDLLTWNFDHHSSVPLNAEGTVLGLLNKAGSQPFWSVACSFQNTLGTKYACCAPILGENVLHGARHQQAEETSTSRQLRASK